MEIEQKVETKSSLSLPVAIVLAGLIIAGAIYFSSTVEKPAPRVPVTAVPGLEKIRPIAADDHIRGNPNAPVIVVEYSDTECPFCVRFHETMKQVIANYGKDGQVAWVYRHSPLVQLHPKAFNEAVALECANELGGNDKFWEYTDRIYEITPANNGLDEAELPKIAEYVGLNVTNFNACLVSGRHDARIKADLQNAQATGGNGTPWSIVITKDGKYPLNGAQPYETVKQMIDSLL